MNLVPLTKPILKNLLKNYYVKYLSQHDPTREYKILYNTENNTFKTLTIENGKELGFGNGTFSLVTKDNVCGMNIKYESVFKSPNTESPMHPDNPFFPHLSNYYVGPFYSKIPNENINWYPVLYNHIQKPNNFKVLNFYKYNVNDKTLLNKVYSIPLL